ncbi:MAG TPA: FkbM family methyltransferase [Vineibacter sp.]|nr:FkbM family methyltransferase [Vineibacter sp.]
MFNSVKESALRIARSFGYDIVPLREVKERDFALHLRQLFELLEIDCVLDVGANAGQYRDFLRHRVRYDGTIVSFESVSRHVEHLKSRSLGDARWHIEGYALGREPGRLPVNRTPSDQISYFAEPDSRRRSAFRPLNAPRQAESVPVRTLDEALPRLQEILGYRRPYLKLDTHGLDLEVLGGAKATLPTVLALQTEASIISVHEGLPGYMDTIRYLNARGFEITGLYPVSRDESLRLIEFDCVMVNADPAPRRR